MFVCVVYFYFHVFLHFFVFVYWLSVVCFLYFCVTGDVSMSDSPPLGDKKEGSKENAKKKKSNSNALVVKKKC